MLSICTAGGMGIAAILESVQRRGNFILDDEKQAPILVTGAAGNVGSVGFKIVSLLREKGLAVRAMVHRIDDRSEALKRLGAEVVAGDLTDLHDVHRVLEGCHRLYFGMSVSATYLEATINVAATAKAQGVKAFVNISQMSVSEMSATATTPSPQHKLHWLAEQALNWSGLPVVHVRATVFLEHFFFNQWAAESIRRAGEIRLPFGKAKTSPIATQDVARVVAQILQEPQPHLGNIYELTGPKSEDLNAIAAEYAVALQRPVRYVDVPIMEWRKSQLQGCGLPKHVVQHFDAMALMHHENRYDRFSNDVEKVTGRKPMSIQHWVKSHWIKNLPTTSESV